MRHGKAKPIWPSILGLFSVSLVIAAIVALIVVDPGKPAPACRYASGSVTVEVTGPYCGSVLRFVATDSDRAWIKTTAPQGSVYSQLKKGKDIVRIYDHGEPGLARALSDHFQKAGWAVVAPSPAPT